MPLILVIAAGADDMEHDATETKLDKSSLHKNLVKFSVLFVFALFSLTFTMVIRMETGILREGYENVEIGRW